MTRRLLAAGLVAVLLAGAGAAVMLASEPVPGDPVEIEIPAGASTIGIAQLLADEDVIGSVGGFRLWSRLRGLDGKIRAGRYDLNRGMGVRAALRALSVGPVEQSTGLTVPEGYTVRQVAARVGERTHISEEDFLDAVTSGRVRPSILPDDVDSLEGFLFPETYRVGEQEGAESVLRKMVSEFDARAAELDWSGAESRGLTRYEAVVVASLVEREAKLADERAKVAAVVYNRLRIGMRLQIDITALYDAPEHKIPTRRDLERESPYNTYLNDGLPPTPIANPGLPSLRAALEPEDITALYYVVIDPSGRHGFADTLEEFNRLRRLCPPERCARRPA